MHSLKRLLSHRSGLTLIEMLVAAAIAAIVTAAIFRLYGTSHNTWLQQEQVSDMQANARASVDEITRHVRMAGSGMDPSLRGVIVPFTIGDGGSDYDTLIVRYNYVAGQISASQDAAGPQQSDKIRTTDDVDWLIARGGFCRVAIVDVGASDWQWMTVSDVDTTNPAFTEIEHLGTLNFTPQMGDLILAVDEYRYYIDNSDSSHPMLIREHDGTAADYAENIAALTAQMITNAGDTLDSSINIVELLSVRTVMFSLRARTGRPDFERSAGSDAAGYRYRTVETATNLRNYSDAL
jgi:prepilin-type N-terminal cleavage/methylation domain-containing protein